MSTTDSQKIQKNNYIYIYTYIQKDREEREKKERRGGEGDYE